MFAQLFTWWNSTTIGTSFTLWRKGARHVGTDEQGNRYFEEKKPTLPGGDGKRYRRWVLYHGLAEASRVPADWHGWLHHTFEEAPTVAPLPRQSWELDHLPNMTGTAMAYHPKGSLSLADGPADTDVDYEAWSPDHLEKTA
ncbi:MAG: NADH:ubiquinone oxidoreductase subunit NDUFA12 [Alphaproteobacteria bacterium]|nr:NADH:ubiquinone oxidoreductase subunit NDUFA12 [Alphaproteobacteria bacterium]